MTDKNASTSTNVPTHPRPPASAASRKFAEYLARRMAPMIDSAAKRQQDHQGPKGPSAE
jgi:hypothetical protein